MIVARENAEYYGLPEATREKKQFVRRPEKHKMVRKDQLVLTGLVILCFCSFIVIAFYFAKMLAIGYQLSMAEKELALLRVESHDLYTEINQLTSLKNIEDIAVNRLGMVKPQNDRIVVVQKVEAKVPAGTEAGVVAEEKKNESKGRDAEKQREQNWLINAFAKMVDTLEDSIKSG